ncbi:hypothetical protein [Plantactinospora sp. B5E13]|uniref:hypothetical protein n=1 Tax=unclassified Plantactinospora TaxID=2631981 RepID=UPI00325F7D23
MGHKEDPESLEDDENPPAASEVLSRLAAVLGLGVATGDVRVDGQNATGHGAMAVGTVNNITVAGEDGGAVWGQTLSVVSIAEQQAIYAPAPSDGELDVRLRRRHLICLRGRPGTGRYTSACLALARRHSPDRICVLAVERLSDLIRRRDLLRGGYGYLLQYDGEQQADGLTRIALAARLESLDSTLLLIGNFDIRDERFLSELVEHRPTPAVEVFRAQLHGRLRGRCVGGCAPCRERCLVSYVEQECLAEPALRAYLDGAPPPGEVLGVVEAIARGMPGGPALTDLLNRLLPEQLRRRATEILTPEGTDSQLAELGGRDYLRAFRLACAVLAGQPVSEISAAAHRLWRNPMGAIDSPAPLRRPDLDLLLGQPLRRAVSVDAREVPAGARTVRFVASAERLPATMLEVAWEEWAIPERLLAWLAELARDGNPGVRQAAAGAMGWAAGRTPDAVMVTVSELSRDRRPGVRQAAGIALVAMATQPVLQRRIRIELDRWLERSAYHRDVVARAYALGLAWLWPDLAVAQLRRVAQQRMQRRTGVVVRGLVEVYQSGRPHLVVPALADWARSDHPELQLQAARTLRALADRWAQPPHAHWPELLDLVSTEVLRIADVAALWSVALRLPGTAYRAWRTLGYWLNQADADANLAELCLELFKLTITDAPLGRRLDHQIRHVWYPIMPHSAMLSRVSRLSHQRGLT